MVNIILVVVGILVLFFILKFIFNTFKTIFYLCVLVVLVSVGLHYFSPKTIDNFIGKERHDYVTLKVNKVVTNITESLSGKAKKIIDDNV